MLIKGFEKLSLLDFDDKLSAVIFYGGCNFKCPFCHNYDLVVNPNKGEDIAFEEIYSYLSKRKNILDAVVFTGGEPTLNKYLKEDIRRIKELGYLIKLDTNGTNPEILKELIDEGLINYVAMDIKNDLNEEDYSLTTGVIVPLDKVLESIRILENSGIEYEFRTTLVKEFHNIDKIISLGNKLKGHVKKYRLQRFIDRGTCLVDNLHEVSLEEAKRYLEVLAPLIENVALRGYE